MARPTLCTPDTTSRLCYALSMGCPLKEALIYARISDTCYYEWLERAEDGEELYMGFADAVKAAEAEFIIKHLSALEEAAKKEWAPRAWLLERRSASNFSRNQTRIKLKQAAAGTQVTDKMLDYVNQILEQVARGEMSVEDAKMATAAIEEQRKVTETIQVKERIDQIERAVKAAQERK